MGQNYTHVITFRLDDAQYQWAKTLRDSMPEQTFTEAGRWLFSSPEVIEQILIRAKASNE